MSSNPPTPDQREPDQRERAEKLDELQQQLQDGARAAGRGLAPEAEREAAPDAAPQVKPEVIPGPQGPWPPWCGRRGQHVTLYALELIALGIPLSLMVHQLMELVGIPITGTWGMDDWVISRTRLGRLATLISTSLRRCTRRFLKAQAALLQRLAERLTGRDPRAR